MPSTTPDNLVYSNAALDGDSVHADHRGTSGLSSDDVAIAAGLSVAAVVGISILIVILMRRRSLRQPTEGKIQEEGLEGSSTDLQDTSSSHRHLRGGSRTTGGTGDVDHATNAGLESGRPEQTVTFDAPPAYCSVEVWKGDGRPLET